MNNIPASVELWQIDMKFNTKKKIGSPFLSKLYDVPIVLTHQIDCNSQMIFYKFGVSKTVNITYSDIESELIEQNKDDKFMIIKVIVEFENKYNETLLLSTPKISKITPEFYLSFDPIPKI
jgi:hypothetical protein